MADSDQSPFIGRNRVVEQSASPIRYRINYIQELLLKSTALIFDVLGFVCMCLIIGEVVTEGIGIAGDVIFFIWFFFLGVDFKRNGDKKLKVMLVNSVLEAIPFLNGIYPGFSIEVWNMVKIMKKEDEEAAKKKFNAQIAEQAARVQKAQALQQARLANEAQQAQAAEAENEESAQEEEAATQKNREDEEDSALSSLELPSFIKPSRRNMTARLGRDATTLRVTGPFAEQTQPAPPTASGRSHEHEQPPDNGGAAFHLDSITLERPVVGRKFRQDTLSRTARTRSAVSTGNSREPQSFRPQPAQPSQPLRQEVGTELRSTLKTPLVPPAPPVIPPHPQPPRSMEGAASPDRFIVGQGAEVARGFDSIARAQPIPERAPAAPAPLRTTQPTIAPSPVSTTPVRPPVRQVEVRYVENELKAGNSYRSDKEYEAMSQRAYERQPDKDPRLLEEETRRNFASKYPQRAQEYALAESGHIYTDTSGQPSLKKDPAYRRMFNPRNMGGSGFNESSSPDVMNAYLQLISRYPEKAREYAKTDKMMERLLERGGRST